MEYINIWKVLQSNPFSELLIRNSVKIALISLNQYWEDKLSNQRLCASYMKNASETGSDLVIFPEMTLTGFSMNIKNIGERRDHSPTVDFFIERAIEYKISVAFGVVFVETDKATNNLIIIDRYGNVLASYAKIHPFSYSGEDDFFLGGDKLTTCIVGNALIGTTICYDLRFPEIFQALSTKCDIIINIANWPAKRKMHWDILLQARAIENQCFIVGVNRIGHDANNISYTNSSVIINPEGEVIKPYNSSSQLDLYEIDLGDVGRIRDSFPLKRDRKVDFYKSIL